jgi:hypothetical protein
MVLSLLRRRAVPVVLLCLKSRSFHPAVVGILPSHIRGTAIGIFCAVESGQRVEDSPTTPTDCGS